MKSTIVVDYDDLEEIFACEDRKLSNNRASYVMNKTASGGYEFLIDADDAVALRAMLTGITKTLAIHEKVKGLVKNDTRKH